MVGYRKNPTMGGEDGVIFFVLPEGWREINKGNDTKKAAQLALEAGWIVKSQHGKSQILIRPPGYKTKPIRVYALGEKTIAD